MKKYKVDYWGRIRSENYHNNTHPYQTFDTFSEAKTESVRKKNQEIDRIKNLIANLERDIDTIKIDIDFISELKPEDINV